MEPDFGGWATKANLRCSDGRTITPEAFKHMDKVTVPLVWQHGHDSPDNVLGHAVLEVRADGVYANGFFNDTEKGIASKKLVMHKDITRLSIWANQLVEKGKTVLHGVIREVSLVLGGANPGAVIDYVRVQHGDDPADVTVLNDEAIIHSGEELDVVTGVQHSDKKTTEDKKDDEVLVHIDETTVKTVVESMNSQQQNILHYLVGAALQAAQSNKSIAQSDDNKDEGNLEHKEQEGTGEVKRNVFENNGGGTASATGTRERHILSHDAMKGIVAAAVRGGSLKHAVEQYAEEHLAHGINDIDLLFPDAKTLNDRPEFNQRRVEWVTNVLNGTRKSPFSRVKSIVADLTQDEARAKGYITGSYKKEEWFGLTSRVTTPTTVYKKQSLDRDDILDITDFDVVAWMKMEMRMMLDEELARAILIGDGRDPGDEDKIKDPGSAAEGAGIRSIANENELYATSVYVNIDDASSDYSEVIEAVLRARTFYKGTGQPTLYTTEAVITEMLLLTDTLGRRFYNNVSELANALRVRDIIPVEVMESQTDVVGIIVNLADYNVGTDRGGEVNLFDDFDIDYNKYKYLMETRMSGALVRAKSALVIRKTASANVLVHPVTSPTFVASTGVVTIPSQTGVVYKNEDTNATLTAGAQSALSPDGTLNVIAVPASGYYFRTNAQDQWTFHRPAA